MVAFVSSLCDTVVFPLQINCDEILLQSLNTTYYYGEHQRGNLFCETLTWFCVTLERKTTIRRLEIYAKLTKTGLLVLIS